MLSLSNTAFLLDFDGTLVDIAPTPHAITIPETLIPDLQTLRAACGDALAIVTGRPIAQIEAYLGDAPYAIAGEHGTALRPAPGAPVQWLDLPPTPQAWRIAAETLARAHPGLRVEPKQFGFVLHYRAIPADGPAIHAALASLLAPDAQGYLIAESKMAWELRPAGADKGGAVRALMAHPPFAGRLPVFVGDDVTDEDGMRAARELGGQGLRVDTEFGSPAGVRAWIAALGALDHGKDYVR